VISAQIFDLLQKQKWLASRFLHTSCTPALQFDQGNLVDRRSRFQGTVGLGTGWQGNAIGPAMRRSRFKTRNEVSGKPLQAGADTVLVLRVLE